MNQADSCGVERWLYSGCLMKICRWVEYGYEKKRGVEHISKILGLSNKKEEDVLSKEREDCWKSQLDGKITFSFGNAEFEMSDSQVNVLSNQLNT